MPDVEHRAVAPDLVDEYLDAHPEWTSDHVGSTARGYARRAELEYPINRAPSTVAAGAIYAAGLTENEKLTQEQVTVACEVSEPALRAAYREIMRHEGYPVTEYRSTGEQREASASGGLRRALTRVIRRV